MLGTRPVVSAGAESACQVSGEATSLAVGVEPHAARVVSATSARAAAICFFTGSLTKDGVIELGTGPGSSRREARPGNKMAL